MALACILFLVAASSFVECFSASQQDSTLPVIISPAVLSRGDVGACPSSDSLNSLRQTVREEIATALQNITSPGMSNCPCGGSGQWTNIADFNFSDPDVACPSGFTLITEPVRGCRRAPGEGPTCKSVIFPSGGQSYSRVCGRVNAYQKGSTDAVYSSVYESNTLEQNYVDGVSLTHGAPGSRQHIWTFAAALTEGTTLTIYICACTNTAQHWPNQVPSHIGSNYFCTTGNPGPGYTHNIIHADDPLWDGEGCGATVNSTTLHGSAQHCHNLPQTTSGSG